MNNDILDYLIPPVRKRCEDDEHKKNNINTKGEVRRTVRLNKELANHITQFSRSLEADFRSSSSGDLKKTTSKLLLDQLSIINLIKKKAAKNNINIKNKNQKCPIPNANVIKITILPISRETQTSKIVVKRKDILKKIHRTVSNTNNLKNNFFCSASHQRTHDIRQISSADLLKPRWERNIKHDELSFNHMMYTKSILDSLNMNHKGKGERVSYEARDVKLSPRNARKSHEIGKEGCGCNKNKINNILDDMNSKKNRVTIVGRLGINENDQYVLNCAATVNNQPIGTYTSPQNASSGSIGQFENNEEINQTTRATQTNINLSFTSNKFKNATSKNEIEQCKCKISKDVATTISECKFIEFSERKSPLIVISVYPKKDTAEEPQDLGDLIQINRAQESQQIDHNRYINSKTMEQKTGDNKNLKGFREKKSPVPQLKTIDKRKVENRTPRNRSPFSPTRSKSPSPPLRSRSRSPTGKSTVKENSINRLIQRTSQKSVRSPDRHKRQVSVSKPQKEKANRKPVIINAAQTSKVNPLKSPFGEIKETNAKRYKIKKAIIDSYTKKLLKPTEYKYSPTKIDTKPKSDASSVTINIDADNERYRVLLLQDKLSTDLNIRRTLKTLNENTIKDLKNKEKNKEHVLEKNWIKEMDNTGVIPEKETGNQWTNSQTLDNGKKGIKIRDSLEMRHWVENGNKEHKNNSYNVYEPKVKIKHKTTTKYANNEDISAVKHYRGDQCCVPSPTARDQEIRDLLGIKKHRSGKSEFVQEVLPELIGQNLHYNLHPEKCARSSSMESHKCYCCIKEKQNEMNYHPNLVSTWTQCDESTVNSYKQMVLNRNIQVFLQVEQFTKQKPIILSRKQYEKVKKTIQRKTSHKSSQERRKLNNSAKCSVVSIGSIRKTRKQNPIVKCSKTMQAEHNSKQKQEGVGEMNCDLEENQPLLQRTAEKTGKDVSNIPASPRQVVSSMEIRYASLAHLRHVTFSSSNIKKSGSQLCFKEKNCPSIQTIFKGHKKCVTPNLGTSAYSLYTDEELNFSDNKYTLYSLEEKPKKPFLRRLMSCLVMRSNRASQAILPQHRDPPSLINSIDSYHINTSLGAIDLTSSLYDTSASFYSNHTIWPVARMKRGFFSSVRGFLTNLKNR